MNGPTLVQVESDISFISLPNDKLILILFIVFNLRIIFRFFLCEIFDRNHYLYLITILSLDCGFSLEFRHCQN